MTTAATSLLGLALPVQGELQGTWGDTVNNSITSLLDSAVAGTTTLSTDADVTLTTTTLAANQAREAILLFSGARTALRNVTAPAQSKIYTVINATTGGYSVVLRGAGPTTGLTIPAGASAVVAWNGSDFIEIGTSSIGNLTVNGNLTVTGTSTLTGAITNTAGTANGVAYLNGSKVLTTGSALVFDGTNLGVGPTPSAIASGYATVHTAGTNGGGIKFGKTGNLSIGYAAASASGVEIGTTASLPFSVFTNNATVATFDNAGNLGLGVTPSAWGGSFSGKTIQIGTTGAISSPNGGSLNLFYNAYYNGTNYIYSTTDYAQRFSAEGNQFVWRNAPSGTAGNAITFTQAMTLAASGGLSVGSTADSGAGNIGVASGKGFVLASTPTTGMFPDDQFIGLKLQTAGGIRFFTNSAESARIDSSGRLLVGTTTAGAMNGKAVFAGSGTASINGLAGSGTGAIDTGITINQTNAGGCLILLASRNTSAGLNTEAAVYILKFNYDGNNAPTAIYVGGTTNFVTFGVSGSNTLTVANSAGGNASYSWFGNK